MQKTENVISKSIFSTSALFHQPSSIFPLPSYIIHQTSALRHQPSDISPQTSALRHQPSYIFLRPYGSKRLTMFAERPLPSVYAFPFAISSSKISK